MQSTLITLYKGYFDGNFDAKTFKDLMLRYKDDEISWDMIGPLYFVSTAPISSFSKVIWSTNE